MMSLIKKLKDHRGWLINSAIKLTIIGGNYFCFSGWNHNLLYICVIGFMILMEYSLEKGEDDFMLKNQMHMHLTFILFLFLPMINLFILASEAMHK